ncbi:unnamed protein product [Caenorhabditis bovis]|uniref:C2H2-type domain-containing protein n=1 Tax=Caenorhabditis bovis TaxID=2654633 RepID=A0A8S1EAV4_9PELO|nr:unnamed protein product [Caenorhabditis bovis]
MTNSIFSRAGPSTKIPGVAMQSYKVENKAQSRVRIMKYPGAVEKPLWECSVCSKKLSSKRSYTEHMNIHNKARPFQCLYCNYAAASQMTLHRHKLRNHTPKTEWGYRCPYCPPNDPYGFYMEPAGYQQHIQIRHFGFSATFGCPFSDCKFTSKSQRYFREHLAKHKGNERVAGGIDPFILSEQELVRYMQKSNILTNYESDDDDDGPPILDRQQDDGMVLPDTDWVESEIEISTNIPRFPNGFFEEELD